MTKPKKTNGQSTEIFPTELLDLASLRPHPRNYRGHPQDQLDHIKESITEHGYYRNVVVARDGTILAGHGVVLAARQMGKAHIPGIRLPLDPDSPQALKILAGDNEISKMGEVDDRALTEILREIRNSDTTGNLLGTGFDDQRLANLVMVTRPASEINTIQEAMHWVGLPEYVNPEETPYKVVVSLRSVEDRDEMLRRLGVEKINSKLGETWSVWFPEKKNDDASAVRFVSPGVKPRYPIYIPSKGRADVCLTARFLRADGVPFYLVVEAQEYDQYAARFGPECILVLPFSNKGSVIYARNWIKQDSIERGYARHWQLDDNIRDLKRRYYGQRITVDSGVALACVEDMADRYENVAILGLNYQMFAPGGEVLPPFNVNCHVYSCALFDNAIPHRWRSVYNEDTDICLQVLADGWCTILVNAFLAFKMPTMKVKGGNTDALYRGDGRLKMARSLERLWPGVVETKRRFRRPQHVIKNQWMRFDNQLRLRPGVSLSDLPLVDEYGMRLVMVKDKIQSDDLRRIYELYGQAHQVNA